MFEELLRLLLLIICRSRSPQLLLARCRNGPCSERAIDVAVLR